MILKALDKTTTIFLIILVIIVIAVCNGYFPTRISRNEAKFEKLENVIPQKYNFNGVWELKSTLKNCDDLSLNGVVTVYQITIVQNSVSEFEGTGNKIGENKDFQVEGKIINDTLTINTFEDGSNRELQGEIKINTLSSRIEYSGEYIGNKNDCDGDIKFKRKK
jgi:hypothetical protein